MAAMNSRPEHPCCRIDRQGDLVLQILAVPGSSRTQIEGLHGQGAQQALRIRLQAPPFGGQANAALLRALADILGVHAREVQLGRGHTSRLKQVRITATALPRIRWETLEKALQS